MSEGSEQRNTEPTDKSITLRGPEILEAGQNIYDQPPFKNLIWASFQESGIPEQGIRRMISYVADGLNMRFDKDTIPQKEELDAHIVGILQRNRDSLRSAQKTAMREQGVEDAGEWRPVMTKICRSLMQYPLWYSYSVDVRSVSRYGPSGDKIREVNENAARDLELPKGYGAWLERESQKKQRITSLTVATIFEESADPQRNRSGGRSNAWKRWRITSADNLRMQQRPQRLPDDLSRQPSLHPDMQSKDK